MTLNKTTKKQGQILSLKNRNRNRNRVKIEIGSGLAITHFCFSNYSEKIAKNRKDERFSIAHMHMAKFSIRLIAGHINRSLVLSAEKCEETKGVIVLTGMAGGQKYDEQRKTQPTSKKRTIKESDTVLKNKPKWPVVDN